MTLTRIQPLVRSFLHQPARGVVLMPRSICEEGQKYLKEKEEETKAAKEAADLWTKITWYVGFPALFLSCLYSYKLFHDHMQHIEEHPPKFIPYSHMRIRNKKFFFGDGDHTLFHNPKVNPDPEE